MLGSISGFPYVWQLPKLLTTCPSDSASWDFSTCSFSTLSVCLRFSAEGFGWQIWDQGLGFNVADLGDCFWETALSASFESWMMQKFMGKYILQSCQGNILADSDNCRVPAVFGHAKTL